MQRLWGAMAYIWNYKHDIPPRGFPREKHALARPPLVPVFIFHLGKWTLPPMGWSFIVSDDSGGTTVWARRWRRQRKEDGFVLHVNYHPRCLLNVLELILDLKYSTHICVDQSRWDNRSYYTMFAEVLAVGRGGWIHRPYPTIYILN